MQNQLFYKISDQIEKISFEKEDLLLKEQQAFYDSIMKKESPVVGWEAGLKALKLAFAVLKRLDVDKDEKDN